MSNAVRSAFSPSQLRLLHSYLSAFIAPTIVFFAISGSLQIYGLHEAHGSYSPSPLVSAMGRLHKDQIFAPVPPRDVEPAAGSLPGGAARSGPPKGGHAGPRTTLATQLLKALFLLEALVLVVTTLLGVWIGVTHPKRARTFWIVIAAGAALPIILIVI